MRTKKCSKCKKIKPVFEFYKALDQKSGYTCACKKCQNIRGKAYRNKPEVKKKRKKYMCKYDATHKLKVKEKNLINKYGITLEKWNKMFEQQNGCCAICGIHQSELKRSLDTDHNHITKKVRGLICHKCNDGLGKFCADDGTELLAAAILYIKRRK